VAASSSNNNNIINDDDFFFDPFLHSPHDYPDGIDSGPPKEGSSSGGVFGAIDPIFESSSGASLFGFSSMSSSLFTIIDNDGAVATAASNDSVFDPLLSPHAYPYGTDAGPIEADNNTTPPSSQQNLLQQQQATANTKTIGILLIDHGSKREESNQHLHFIAQTYEASIIQRDATTASSGGGQIITTATVVRAAHMEIAEPNILTSLVSIFYLVIVALYWHNFCTSIIPSYLSSLSLSRLRNNYVQRNMIINDKVTEIVCVPYFLSPGKHSTVDVPNLIAEAKLSLEEEGLLHHDENNGGGFVNILTSQALGTQLEFMLGGVDELVNLTLKDGVDN
jgi:hypothetical protein